MKIFNRICSLFSGKSAPSPKFGYVNSNGNFESLDTLSKTLTSKGRLPLSFSITQSVIWSQLELANKRLSSIVISGNPFYEQVAGAANYKLPETAHNYGIAIREPLNNAGSQALALYVVTERTTRDGPTTYTRAGYVCSSRDKILAEYMDLNDITVVRAVFNKDYSGYHLTTKLPD